MVFKVCATEFSFSPDYLNLLICQKATKAVRSTPQFLSASAEGCYAALGHVATLNGHEGNIPALSENPPGGGHRALNHGLSFGGQIPTVVLPDLFAPLLRYLCLLRALGGQPRINQGVAESVRQRIGQQTRQAVKGRNPTSSEIFLLLILLLLLI